MSKTETGIVFNIQKFCIHDGVDAMTNEKISIETGNPVTFTTYERFEKAFMDQLEFVTYNSCSSANRYQQMRGVFQPHPLRSCLIEGCLKKSKASFIALAKAFFAGGGQQYTISVVSPDELLDAKEHPENYRNLIVRVGGYSDYFVNLTTELQDNVIERSFVNV